MCSSYYVGLAGGITHVKKISSIAESYHSSVVTHNYLGPVITAASCNIDTSIPNFITQEFSTIDESPINQIFKTDWVRKNGFIDGPNGRWPEGHPNHPWEAEAIKAENSNN